MYDRESTCNPHCSVSYSGLCSPSINFNVLGQEAKIAFLLKLFFKFRLDLTQSKKLQDVLFKRMGILIRKIFSHTIIN